MTLSYNKLCKLLIHKNMRKVDLRNAIRITPATVTKLSKNQNVKLDVLSKICQELNCNIGDIIDFIPKTEGGDK